MKNVVIVGASSDLADDIMPRLLNDGFSLLLHCGKNIEKLEVYRDNPKVEIVADIIESESDCRKFVERCIEWKDNLHGLVVMMGGIGHPIEWEKLGIGDYQQDYLLNTVYPVIIATELSQKMKEYGGRIVFVSTASAGHGGGHNSLSYGMAKAALECATKRFAKDLAKYGILVNAIAPGYMDTSIQVRSKGIPANENKERLKTIPLGRSGSKQEFAGLVEYLMSDDASFLTGQVITLDGGDFI